MSLKLRLDWPPSNNVYYRRARGLTIISDEGKAYVQRVKVMMMAAGIRRRDPIKERIAVRITTNQPTANRCDLDNFQKVALDSMTKSGVWADDSLIDDLHIRRGPIVKGGSLSIAIRTAVVGSLVLPGPRTPGQIAYDEVHRDHVFAETWADVDPMTRAAYEAAATAVIAHHQSTAA